MSDSEITERARDKLPATPPPPVTSPKKSLRPDPAQPQRDTDTWDDDLRILACEALRHVLAPAPTTEGRTPAHGRAAVRARVRHSWRSAGPAPPPKPPPWTDGYYPGPSPAFMAMLQGV